MVMDIINEVFGLFDRFGDRVYGEAVSQRQHALQAAHFARADDAPDTLIAAALLHDVGQFLNGAGQAAEQEGRDARHEIGGADYLAPYFPAAVVAPIRLHVAAKRYLCAIEPGYQHGLSAASALSLRLQGGAFSAKEAEQFLAQPFAPEAVRLRRYDELGKQDDMQVAPLESYRDLLSRFTL
jgi:[1-hydroxy-2-(trimethylamino)ethyl]phosphonate dioxygenase